MDVNYVLLSGRLTKDPELAYSKAGGAWLRGSIAVSRGKNKDGEYEKDFFNFVVFKTLAENIANNCNKGSEITIQGTVNNNNYEKKDKTKVYGTQITVSKAYFAQSSPGMLDTSSGEFREIDDDDVPY